MEGFGLGLGSYMMIMIVNGVNVRGEETNPQIINLRWYTVVAGEPDVVTR